MLLRYLMKSTLKKNKKKTTFSIKYRLFKYIIMSFRLYNTLNIFQAFINNSLQKYLNIFYIIHLNNILIYSDIENKYI